MSKKKIGISHAKESQLLISLKFHFSETLADIPLDVALNVMSKAWESCQGATDNCNYVVRPAEDDTLVCDREQVERAIYL